MPKSITEAQIERYNLELLNALGYSYKSGETLAPQYEEDPSSASWTAKDITASYGDFGPDRTRYSEVLLKNRLKQAIDRLNPHIPAEARTQAQRELQNINSPDLISNNETFHSYLTEGITVE